MPETFEQVVAGLRADPVRTAVLIDFDGTLAPIVDDPAAATPLVDAVAALEALATLYGTVAVVSGRPVSFLQHHLGGTGVALVGLYGLERCIDGTVLTHPSAEGWGTVIDEAVAAAAAELPAGVEIEHKGRSLTLHVRRHADALPDALTWAAHASGRWGLEQRPARMSVELHPPVAVDKGTVVRELAAQRTAACYIGDDVGDLPAFDALDALAAEGCAVHRVVVSSEEIDPTLVARADLILAGPDVVVELLQALLA